MTARTVAKVNPLQEISVYGHCPRGYPSAAANPTLPVGEYERPYEPCIAALLLSPNPISKGLSSLMDPVLEIVHQRIDMGSRNICIMAKILGRIERS